jgi:hypothetical protein
MTNKPEAEAGRPAVVTIAGWVAAITFPLSLLVFLREQSLAIEAGLANYLISKTGVEGAWTTNLLWFTIGILIALVFLMVVGVIGLMRMKRWAWVFLVVMMTFSLMMNLARVWIGAPQYVIMLVYAVNALLLNQPEVRRAFRIGVRVDEDAI